MCADPVTIAFAGVSLAAGIARARAQAQAGRAQADYYNAVARSNEQQAEVAKRTGQKQAEVTQDVAKERGRRLATSQAEFRASQEAAFASAGVTGVSVEDVAISDLSKQQQDELSLRFNADVESFQAKTNAQNRAFSFQHQAFQSKVAANNAISAGRRNAFGTILGTVASVAMPFAFRPFTPAVRQIGPLRADGTF